jgi:hypothetical protein
MKIGDWALVAGGAALVMAAVVGIYDGNPGSADAKPKAERGAAEAQPAAGKDQDDERVLGSQEMPLTGSSTAAQSRAASPAPSELRIANQLALVNGKLEAAQREKRDLEAQLRGVKEELAQSAESAAVAANDEFDLDRDDWKKLAADGRIKYRIPCFLPPEYTTPQAELDNLGLSPEDGRTLTEAHRRSNGRIWATVRPLCMKAVDDASVVDLLGTMSCLRIIEQKAAAADHLAIGNAKRQVAEVHAGVRPAPRAGEPRSPLFDAYLALSSEGQLFEQDLAESFGPEEGKRIAQSLSCSASSR